MSKLFYFLSKKNKIIFYIIIIISLLAFLFNIASSLLVVPLFLSIVDIDYLNNGQFNFLFTFLKIDLKNNFENALFIVLGIIILSYIIVFLSNILKICYQNLLISEIKNRYFHLITNLNFKNYVNLSRTDLNKDVTIEIDRLVVAYLIPVNTAITKIILLVVVFVIISISYPIASLLCLAILLFMNFAIYRTIRKKLQNKSIEHNRIISSQSHHVSSLLSQFKIIYIYGLELNYNQIFQKITSDLKSTINYFEIIRTIPRLFIEIVVFSSLIFTIYYFYSRGSEGVEVITLLAFAGICFIKLIPVIQDVFFNITLIKSNKEIFKYLKSKIEFFENNQKFIASKKDPLLKFEQKISLKNICYEIKNKPIFKNVTLELNKNKIIGIVGPSGSGKTTLVDIICGLLDPTSGHIFIDDIKLENKNKSTYQNSISYCSYSSLLINDSIKNNILFFQEENEEKLSKIIKLCNLDAFIKNLKFGINTKVGDDSSLISAGESQRIAFARTLYSDKEIVILDEFTSNLDAKSEIEILQKIKKIKQNKLMLIISHKENPLSICDEIYQIRDFQLHRVNKLKNEQLFV